MADETEKVISVPEESTASVAPATTVAKPNGADAPDGKKRSPSADAAAQEAADILKKQLEDERAETTRLRASNAESERRAREAEARAGQSDATAKNSIVGQLTAAIDARTGAREAASAALQAAWEAGDFKEAAKIQVRIADLSAELLQLNAGKAQAEEQAKAPARVERVAPVNDVEAFIERARLPARSASWIREHPTALAEQNLLAGAHDRAMKELGSAGFETPEYFATIERIMGFEKKANGSNDGQDGAADETVTVRPRTESRRAPAAPPSSSAGSQNARAREVRMTPEMRKAAEISGITEEEYAANYLKAKAQGLLQ